MSNPTPRKTKISLDKWSVLALVTGALANAYREHLGAQLP